MPSPRRPSSIGLSKSRLMRGIQCSKNLYLHIHHKELEPPVDAAQQAIFDLGHQVGLEAQKRFPEGVFIDAKPWELDKAATLTAEAIQKGAHTIFEATFHHQGITARVDILHRESLKGPWNIIEVKSSTDKKPEHVQDIAIQSWVLAGAGIRHESCILMHINSECVAPDLGDLFTAVEVTADVQALLPKLPEQVAKIRQALELPSPPEVDIGLHCSKPYDCPFTSHCWKEKKIPELSVFDLPSIGVKAWKLYKDGVIRLDDERLSNLTVNQQRMVEAYKSGTRYVDRAGIQAALAEWQWPLHYFDFETVNPGIPRFDGTSPYQQVPFQFSLHLQMKPGGELLHFEYLHGDGSDPREPLVRALLDAVASRGSIVSYNKAFEEGCLRKLAEQFTKYRSELEAMCERLVDPWPIIKTNVYDPAFNGSFSLKAVAPALLGQKVSYEGMDVAQGGDAVLAYEEMVRPGVAQARRAEIRKALLEYCKKDTLNLVLLVEWMGRQ